jgi:uncharacterized membrane protein
MGYKFMWKKLRSILILGVLASAPLALTVYVFIGLFTLFDSLFQPLVQRLPFVSQPIPGLGIVMGLIFIFIVGLLAPSLIGKQLLIATERILERVPLAKLVYSGTKQIFDSFTNETFKKFNRVVLVEFPRKGAYTLGFVTAEYQESLVPGANARIGVFVPTTPNPTGGYLIFLAPEDLVEVAISAEEALKLILSGGLVKTDRLLPSSSAKKLK